VRAHAAVRQADLDLRAGQARRRLQDEGADIAAHLKDDAAGTGRAEDRLGRRLAHELGV
jgi:hypothetical protein